VAYDSYLVREEDGTSHLLVEDSSGALILETAVLLAATATRGPRRGRPQPFQATFIDDEDAVAAILALI